MRRDSMKKGTVLMAVAALLIVLAVPISAGGNEDDLRVIKKAVKGSTSIEPERTAKWFKVLVVDNKSGRETLKITLPISIAKLLAHCEKDRHAHMDRVDIDIAAALRDLEELSPMTLLEIVNEETTIRIWLE